MSGSTPKSWQARSTHRERIAQRLDPRQVLWGAEPMISVNRGNPEQGSARERLIRASYRLISERGVHRVSLDQIAAAAAVSKGLIIYHYGSRENLILATMEWVLNQVAARIRPAVERGSTAQAKIRAMLDVIFNGADANRRFYLTYIELVEHAARFDRFTRLNEAFGAVVRDVYSDLVKAGSSSGAFAVTDVDEAARVMRAIIDGMFLMWLQEADGVSTHRAYQLRCENALLRYLCPPQTCDLDGDGRSRANAIASPAQID